MIKKILIIIVLSFYFSNSLLAAENITIEPLKSENNNIFDYGEAAPGIIEYRYTTSEIKNFVKTINNKMVFENSSLRTPTSQTYQISDNEFNTIFYSSPQFLKDETTGLWKQIETASTTLDLWKNNYQTPLSVKIKNILFPYAMAVDFYSGGANASDGTFYKVIGAGDTFTNLRSAAAAGSVSNRPTTDGENLAVLRAYTDTNKWSRLYRSHYGFDTASLPDDATITAGSMSFFVLTKYGDAGTSYYGLTGFAPTDPANIVVGDFSKFTDTRLASDLPYSGLTAGSLNTFTLNTAGKAYVKLSAPTTFMLRTGYDIDNSPPAWSSDASFADADGRFSGYTGTASDPILSLTYTTGGGPVITQSAYLSYIDDATTQMIYFSFILILIIFLTNLMLKIISNFFNKAVNIGKKNDFTGKN